VGADPVRDTCTGDDGGPLVDKSGTPQLVGVVASGVGCAQAQLPASTPRSRTRSCMTSSRLTTTGPVPALLVPQFGAITPWLSGVLKEGQTLTCSPGDWFNNPTYEFTFIDPNSGRRELQTATGPSAQYIVQASDVGHDIVCRARAANVQGSLNVKSTPSGRRAPSRARRRRRRPDDDEDHDDHAEGHRRVDKTKHAPWSRHQLHRQALRTARRRRRQRLQRRHQEPQRHRPDDRPKPRAAAARAAIRSPQAQDTA